MKPIPDTPETPETRQEPKKESCFMCAGTGERGPNMRCSTCEGTGKVGAREPQKDERTIEQMEAEMLPCPICDALRSRGSSKCMTCDSTLPVSSPLVDGLEAIRKSSPGFLEAIADATGRGEPREPHAALIAEITGILDNHHSYYGAIVVDRRLLSRCLLALKGA